MFRLKTHNFTTKQHNDIHYLYADSDMFGDCRFGDLMMYGTLLFFLKKYLIKEFPLFNENNLYFIFNRRKSLYMLNGSLRFTLNLFNNVWAGIDTNESNKFNIRQIIDPGNLWAFKTFLDQNKITIDASDKIIDPKRTLVPFNKRDKIYINPIRQKKYNIERNLTDQEIISIINKISLNETVYIITEDNNLDIRKINQYIDHRIKEVSLDDDYEWSDILINMMSSCKRYIGGDCGLTHFVSLLDITYKPDIDIYYRTKSFTPKKIFNQFDESVKEVDFKPYCPYGENDTLRIHYDVN